MIDGLVERKLRRKQTPLASAPQDVEDGIDHLAHIGRTRATTAFGRGNERCQDGPFRLGEICWVALRHPMPSTAGSKRANLTTQTTFQTGSHVAAGNRLVPRRNAGAIPPPTPRTFVAGTSDTGGANAPRLSCRCVP